MSSETSRTAAATGKAYRALKELVRATLLCTLEPRVTRAVAALLAALTPPHATANPKWLAPKQSNQLFVVP